MAFFRPACPLDADGAPRRVDAVDALCLGLCRVGMAGLARFAPGTWGSLVGAVFAPIWFLPFSTPGRCLVLAGLFLVGGVAASRVERVLRQKDPGEVVIDEVLGVWVSLAPFADVTLPLLAAAVVLFRVFDILKPWPVSASEDWLPGGFGVMLDDAVAGLLTMVCLVALRCLALL